MLDVNKLASSGGLLDNHYRLIRPLSTDGGTADVWLALDANTVRDPDSLGDISHMNDDEIEKLGLIVAIKIYRPQNALDIEGEQRFRDEYMIVFNCHHANLIHPTHFSIFQETPYLVMPYCKLGSSELLIGNLTGDDNIWKYILDVSSGLAYLHAQTPPIIHQDIKPANVLLDDNLNYCITDFGISAKSGNHEDDYLGEELSGTMAYMAPERFVEGSEPSTASDVWAFGAAMHEILTGNVPFGDQGGYIQTQQQVALPVIEGLSPDIQRLIHACLDADPEKRPTAAQIEEAAKARQYPVKKKKVWLMVTVAVVLALLIGGAAAFYLTQQEPTVIVEYEEAYVPTDEEVYTAAMQKIDQLDADSLKAGLDMLEELRAVNYVPAIYQLAYTYGWYSDTLSVKRKELLNIDMDSRFMPRSDRWNNRAIDLFTRIMEIGDSAYADINANATYRLALYYVMPNELIQPNYEKGKRFLLRSREWATLAGDDDLLGKIERGLASFQ